MQSTRKIVLVVVCERTCQFQILIQKNWNEFIVEDISYRYFVFIPHWQDETARIWGNNIELFSNGENWEECMVMMMKLMGDVAHCVIRHRMYYDTCSTSSRIFLKCSFF